MNKYTKLLSALCIIGMTVGIMSGCGSKPSNDNDVSSFRGEPYHANNDSSYDSIDAGSIDILETDSFEAVSSQNEYSSLTVSSNVTSSVSSVTGASENVGTYRNGKYYFGEVPQLPAPDYLTGVSFSSRSDFSSSEDGGFYFYEYSVDKSLDIEDVLKLYGEELKQIDFEYYDEYFDDDADPIISLSESRGEKFIYVLIYPDTEDDHVIDISIDVISQDSDSSTSSSSVSSSSSAAASSFPDFSAMYQGTWEASYIIDKNGEKNADDSSEELYLGFLGVFTMELGGEHYQGTWSENDDGIVLNFDDEANSVAYGTIIYEQHNNYLEIEFEGVDSVFGYVKK
ncbi:MAG: hypothetical protein II440_06655 [Clostridia bacterium]|nr:hypothetical protein [Clostridia bacterium]